MSRPESDNTEDMSPPAAGLGSGAESVLRDDGVIVQVDPGENADTPVKKVFADDNPLAVDEYAESSAIDADTESSARDDDEFAAIAPVRFPESAVESEGVEHETESKVMSVIDHLDELRTRVIRSLLVFAAALGLCFYFGKNIIKVLELPAGDMKFQALSIEEPVIVFCKVSFYAAIVLAAPYLLYEISSFIAPGLKKNERRVLAPIIVGGPLLFITGAVFCYYLVLPPMLFFFNSFSGGLAPVQQRLDYYISLVTTMLFYMGICFQLPIVLFALSLAGIVNSKQLLSFWRYALVGSSLVAAIITPDPTVISMLIVWAALIGLYFFTILLLKIFKR